MVIQFDKYAADFIREKRWHASQKVRELPDGGIELSMKLSSLGEVQRWVLGWGANAKVISPAELAQQIRQAAESILRNH